MFLILMRNNLQDAFELFMREVSILVIYSYGYRLIHLDYNKILLCVYMCICMHIYECFFVDTLFEDTETRSHLWLSFSTMLNLVF